MLLAIDTSGQFCSAACLDTKTGKLVFERSDNIGRGHAESLMPMLEEELASAKLEWSDISSIAVVVGPGSFTGVRVGLAAARGLALARSIPCIGVTVFEALYEEFGKGEPLACVMDARRDQAWFQFFEADGVPGCAPSVVSLDDVKTRIPPRINRIVGSAAPLIEVSDKREAEILSEIPSPPIGAVAMVALSRDAETNKPVPLYLRDADAKPQTGFRPE